MYHSSIPTQSRIEPTYEINHFSKWVIKLNPATIKTNPYSKTNPTLTL